MWLKWKTMNLLHEFIIWKHLSLPPSSTESNRLYALRNFSSSISGGGLVSVWIGGCVTGSTPQKSSVRVAIVMKCKLVSTKACWKSFTLKIEKIIKHILWPCVINIKEKSRNWESSLSHSKYLLRIQWYEISDTILVILLTFSQLYNMASQKYTENATRKLYFLHSKRKIVRVVAIGGPDCFPTDVWCSGWQVTVVQAQISCSTFVCAYSTYI